MKIAHFVPKIKYTATNRSAKMEFEPAELIEGGCRPTIVVSRRLRLLQAHTTGTGSKDVATSSADAHWAELLDRGFTVVPSVLPQQLLVRLRSLVNRLCDGQSAKSTKALRSQGSMFPAMSDPLLAELITLPRALDMLKTMSGCDSPTFTDGYIISKPGQSPPLFWHYDWFSWSTDADRRVDMPPQVFFMYYLQETTPINGCLRVIPRSHRQHNPLHDAIGNPHRPEVSKAKDMGLPEFSQRRDEVDVPVHSGDLVIGDARLLHAAHSNATDRRRTVVTLWMQPNFDSLPEPTKAQMVQKTQRVPESWSRQDRERVEALHPRCRYTGRAQPTERQLYSRHARIKPC